MADIAGKALRRGSSQPFPRGKPLAVAFTCFNRTNCVHLRTRLPLAGKPLAVTFAYFNSTNCVRLQIRLLLEEKPLEETLACFSSN